MKTIWENIITSVEEFLIAGVLIQMVLLSFLQVVLRYCFHSAFPWAEELLRLEIVFITFMSSALAVKRGAHISVDFVCQISPPRVRMVLSVTGHIVSAVLCFFLCWLAFKTLTLLQAYGMVTPALGMPVYVPYIPMGVGCFLMATRSLIRARQMLLGGSLDPKGDKS